MLVSATWVCVMLIGHWLADFVWQPDWMARGKAKDWLILSRHAVRVAVGYAAAASVIVLLGGRGEVLTWAALNGIAHFAIDAVTSRITSRLWAAERLKDFFNVVGLDQMLHLIIATLTLAWLFAR